MNIILNEVPKETTKSFTLFADPDRKLLRETKTVRVCTYYMSKTRISTDIQFGNYCTKINFPIDGYKTHADTQWNMLSGVQSTSYYFIKSKKQNLEAYKEYVKKCVKLALHHLMVELDEITIELEMNF